MNLFTGRSFSRAIWGQGPRAGHVLYGSLRSLSLNGARFARPSFGGARFARTEMRRALASLVRSGARFARGGGDARFARSDEAKAPLKRNGDR